MANASAFGIFEPVHLHACGYRLVWTPRSKNTINHILSSLSCISVTKESDQGLQKGTIKQSSTLFADQIPIANASTGDIITPMPVVSKECLQTSILENMLRIFSASMLWSCIKCYHGNIITASC